MQQLERQKLYVIGDVDVEAGGPHDGSHEERRKQALKRIQEAHFTGSGDKNRVSNMLREYLKAHADMVARIHKEASPVKLKKAQSS